MESKIMQVFYGTDCLPYKDKERTVHYPIIGNVFTGANNTTQIRFYCDRIGGDSAQWVAATQRPTGKAGYELLTTKVYDDEVGEYYFALNLNSWYTQYKGDIYISLHGYVGGVLIEQDEDTGIYEISGTPTIQTTGAIKIAINYAPQVLPVAEIPLDTLQDILGAISEKIDTPNAIYVAPNVVSLSMSDYENGQIFYDKTTKLFYINDNGTLTYYAIDNAIRSYDFDEYTYIGEINDTVGVGQMFLMTLDGHKTLAYLYAPTEDSFAIHFWNEIEYGDTSPVEEQSTLVGDLDFSRHYYFPYIEKNNLSGSLTDEELEILSQPNSVFICLGNIMHKVSSTRFERISASTSGTGMSIATQYITINTSTKTFAFNTYYIPSYTSSGVDSLLAQKQNLLINEMNIKSLTIDGVVKSLLGSGTISITTGGSVAEWGNIGGDIQDQTDLQNELTEIREVAEGKCKTLILSYNQTDVGINSFYDVDGTLHPNSDFSSFVSGYSAGNSLFNSNNNNISPIGNSIAYLGTKYYFIFESLGNDYNFPTINKVVVKSEELYDLLRNGDIILITEVDVPDRWISKNFQSGYAYKLETSKIDLTSYATLTDLSNAISGVLSNLAGLYDSTLTYTIGEVVIHDNKLYSCSTTITTPEAWDSTHWTQTTIASEFVNLHGSQVIDGDKIFSNGLYTTDSSIVDSSNGLSTQYRYKGQVVFYISASSFQFAKSFYPIGNNLDIGFSQGSVRDIYINRYLTDNTYSYTIAESMAQFNPIMAGTNVIKWSKLCVFNLSADTTLTLETTKTDCYCEYKALITNSGASAITLTFTGVSNFLTNDEDNVVITNGTNTTIALASGTTIEVSIVNGKGIAVNFEVA